MLKLTISCSSVITCITAKWITAKWTLLNGLVIT